MINGWSHGFGAALPDKERKLTFNQKPYTSDIETHVITPKNMPEKSLTIKDRRFVDYGCSYAYEHFYDSNFN